MKRHGWLPLAVGVGVALNTLRLRQRLSSLVVAEPSDAPVDSTHVFLVADGVRLDAAQRRAASAYAVREGLDVVDLVPAQLSADRLLDLARLVDTRTYRGARLAPGRGAFVALLVDRDLLARTGLEPTELDEITLVAILETAKRYAPARTGLVVLPGFAVGPRTGATRSAVQRAAYAWDPARPLFPLIRDVTLAAGTTASPPAAVTALAALALSVVQPRLVAGTRLGLTSGLRLTPEGLLTTAADRRLGAARSAVDLLRRPTPESATGGFAALGFRHQDPAIMAAKAAEYRDDLRDGLDRFFEPQRENCPWCGSRELTQRLVATDVAQSKPGRFGYDACGGCGHVFQNPRLSLDGLEFYYRDFYDGLGAATMEVLFGFNPQPYLDRARDVPAQPRRWLDVGGGLGHFCNVARDVWPATSFDGLDIGAGIDEAERRGWVDNAYRGLFPDLATKLAGAYDVVSMFHYLEHTRDPLAELDAAATVLAPGQHLLVEVPNPRSPAARAYGRLWPGWLVPQHQHLMPADNLAVAMEHRGFTVQWVRFGEVHQPGDPVIALWSLLQRVAPSPTAPWRDEPNPRLAQIRRAVATAAVVPAFGPAILLDGVTRPYFVGKQRSNAYRILARRA